MILARFWVPKSYQIKQARSNEQNQKNRHDPGQNSAYPSNLRMIKSCLAQGNSWLAVGHAIFEATGTILEPIL